MAEILYQGHGSFRITGGGAVVYVDPYAGEGYDLPADLVLVSHEHYDHTSVGLVKLKPDGVIFRGADHTDGKRYDSVAHAGVSVRAVPACNRNHPITECVGFIIGIDGAKIYAAGDTSETEFMRTLRSERLDVALLPTDGVFNMDAAEASRCAELIGAAVTMPIHTKPGELFDPSVAARFRAEGKVVLRPGETFVIPRK